MKRFLKLFFSILFLWFIGHSILIIVDGLTDEKSKSDVGVVLGNKVNPDGSLSERLEKRLDKSIELYSDSLINLIVVSGGLGKEGFYEGTKMQEYLIQKGVPIKDIIVDNNGNTTEATARNFRNMDLKVNSITVITQYYHITRTKLAFRNEGYENVKGAHADYFEIRDLYSIPREGVGYYKYLLTR